MTRAACRRIELATALVLAALASTRLVPTTAADQAERPAPPPAGHGFFEGVVKKAFREQASLIASKEHCSADPRRLHSIGRGVGEQVRVARGDSAVALFTVSEARDEQPETIVRMGQAAHERFGAPDEFPATVLATVPHPTLTDAEARRAGEFVERSDDDGVKAGLLVLAPHGGDIERFTAEQAERVSSALAGKPVTTWRCLGWSPSGGGGPSAFARWHITSTDIHEASFPRLGKLSRRRFAYALSFHGMEREGVLIGGAGPASLKQELRDAIARALAGTDLPIDIAAQGAGLGGTSPSNIVNRYCPGTGIQIEQSSRTRRDHWKAIADAVAVVYSAKL